MRCLSLAANTAFLAVALLVSASTGQQPDQKHPDQKHPDQKQSDQKPPDKKQPEKKKKNAGRPGEVITPAAKGERIKGGKLKAGDHAPDFTLPLLKCEETVTLSSYQGKRSVVLIFASYT